MPPPPSRHSWIRLWTIHESAMSSLHPDLLYASWDAAVITASACPRRYVRRDRKWRRYDHIRRRHIALTARHSSMRSIGSRRAKVWVKAGWLSRALSSKRWSPREVWDGQWKPRRPRVDYHCLLYYMIVSCQLLDCSDIRGLEEYLHIVSSTLIIFFSSLKNSFTMVVKFNFECSDPTINSPLLCPARTTKVGIMLTPNSNNNSKTNTFLVLVHFNFNVLSTKMS